MFLGMVEGFKKDKNKNKKEALEVLFYLLGAGIGGGRSAMPVISWL
jgi:hypothetical protein